jgi:hypothetical protein
MDKDDTARIISAVAIRYLDEVFKQEAPGRYGHATPPPIARIVIHAIATGVAEALKAAEKV